MTKKIRLTGRAWKEVLNIDTEKTYDVISITGQEFYPKVKFRLDENEYRYAFPEDPDGPYSLAGEVFEWPEVKPGDKIRATKGENVLVGVVTDEERDEFDDPDIIIFEVDGQDGWSLEPREGFTVEVIQRAKPPATFAEGTVFRHPESGRYIIRTNQRDAWMVSKPGGESNHWTDEWVTGNRGSLELVYDPTKS